MEVDKDAIGSLNSIHLMNIGIFIHFYVLSNLSILFDIPDTLYKSILHRSGKF